MLWKRCFWCGKEGKCFWGFQPTLLDVDGIGLLCEPCHERGWPPHAEYLQMLLRPVLKGDPHLAEIVSEFIYPVFNFYALGLSCYKCDPTWVGWVCAVCERHREIKRLRDVLAEWNRRLAANGQLPNGLRLPGQLRVDRVGT